MSRPHRREVLVCGGAGCTACDAVGTAERFERAVADAGLSDTVGIARVGCMGLCSAGPLVLVSPDGTCYCGVTAEAVDRIVAEHLVADRPVESCELTWTDGNGHQSRGREVPFFARQHRVVLRNCGVIDPRAIEEYIALDGYLALERAVGGRDGQSIVSVLQESGLRGRDGGAAPVGWRWAAVAAAPGASKYVVCRADPGDSGGMADATVLAGDPHAVVEGMVLAGRAVGAKQGFIAVRAGDALVLERLADALAEARRFGVLGNGILGSDLCFEIEIRAGPGAAVCGGDSALLRALEGARPVPAPPGTGRDGLFGRPTVIENAETLAAVPVIVRKGAPWFAGIGTPPARGTRVLVLTGAIRNAGVVEVPCGIPLRTVVEEIGGGASAARALKAVLVGGPSGGCVSAAAVDIPVDHGPLGEWGARVDPGTVTVLDEGACIVNVVRAGLAFVVAESCGKCPPCRVGTRVMLNLLDRIAQGDASVTELETLEILGEHIRRTSLCRLGRTAPEPVLSTLRHFRAEYLAHLDEHGCPLHQCAAARGGPAAGSFRIGRAGANAAGPPAGE
ncbi:MAG: NADH-ubiquinone oxidoreductase-F iron-sulfur binding region domain-containing protein [Acidobacteriota bacterium]